MVSKNQNRLRLSRLALSQMTGRRLRSRLRLRQGVKEAWLRIKTLPLWIKQCVIIILGAEAQTYSGVIVNWISTAFASKTVDVFLRHDYHRSMPVSWICYYCSQEVEKVLWAYVFCKITAHLSNYLFLFFVVIFGYTCFGLIMFWVDFKRSELLWIDAFWTVIMFTWSIFRGYREETICKIKSLF